MQKNKEDKVMKDIQVNRFLTWLMWAIPIFLCGPLALAAWTGIQLAIYDSEKKAHIKEKTKEEEERERKNREERELALQILEMNKPENIAKLNLTGCKKDFVENRNWIMTPYGIMPKRSWSWIYQYQEKEDGIQKDDEVTLLNQMASGRENIEKKKK